nr:RNA-directed DNA polymerase, eukaryota [Tanacetum cinerariifolium]
MWVCSLATTVWNRVFIWLDLSPPDFLSLHGLFSWLDDLHISSSKKDIIEVVCGVVLWSLWNFRNDMIFDDTHPSRSTLFDKIKCAAVDNHSSIAIPGSKIPSCFKEQQQDSKFKMYDRIYPLEGERINASAANNIGNVWVAYIPFTLFEKMRDSDDDFQGKDGSDVVEGSESVMPNTTNLAAISDNVQSLGSHERIMALDLPHGGHISLGYHTHTKKKITQEGQKDENLNFVKLPRDVKFKEDETWDWNDYMSEHTDDEPEWTDFKIGDPEVTYEHHDQ